MSCENSLVRPNRIVYRGYAVYVSGADANWSFRSSGRAPICHSFHVRSQTITIPAEMLLRRLSGKLTDFYANTDRTRPQASQSVQLFIVGT